MKKDLFSGLSKKNFDLKKFKELKRILSKQGIVIKRKPFSNINFRFDEFKSLYLTGLASFLIVMFSFIIPLSVDIDNQIASKNDSKIMWNDEAENILAKINALNPRPGAWFEYEGSRYKVWKAEIIKGSQNIPGLVIDEKLTIACKKDSIKIVEIQKEGKNKLKLNEFLAGTRVQKNKILSS